MRVFIFILAFCSTPSAHAYFQLDFLNAKRSNNKEASQWTLADWLSQKSRMRLADQWLAMNRSTGWFELNTSAAHSRYRLKTTSAGVTAEATGDAQTYTLDMYLSLFNLYGEYEKTSTNQEEYGGAVGLRLLGLSSQTTNLVARYGWRRLQDLSAQERWDNQYAEGQLQLYIIRAVGLLGQYRYYFPSESNLGTRMEGQKVTAGAFIENAYFRIFANYYQQPLRLKVNGNSPEDERREGYDAGIKLFF